MSFVGAADEATRREILAGVTALLDADPDTAGRDEVGAPVRHGADVGRAGGSRRGPAGPLKWGGIGRGAAHRPAEPTTAWARSRYPSGNARRNHVRHPEGRRRRPAATREELLVQHADARRRRNAAVPAATNGRQASQDVGRIEVEIARLERAMDPPRV